MMKLKFRNGIKWYIIWNATYSENCFTTWVVKPCQVYRFCIPFMNSELFFIYFLNHRDLRYLFYLAWSNWKIVRWLILLVIGIQLYQINRYLHESRNKFIRVQEVRKIVIRWWILWTAPNILFKVSRCYQLLKVTT